MELLADRDPEEARKLLDPVLERMMEAVHRYEGTVNQVMGDGIMALFGAPLAHEDHAVRACYAALRMQDTVRRYAEEARRAAGVPIHIRVGLNSGEVVVRSIGSDLRMDYTAVGQTTHLAARMEQAAMPGSIVVTGDTLRLAEGFVHGRALGPIPVKGLAEAVAAYEVTGAGQVRTRLQASVARGLSRFVGRDEEMQQLRRSLDEAREGHGQVVAVVGEPGVGKSRLFYELTRSHRVHDWLVLEASSVPYGRATSYLPIIGLLRTYFRIDDRDDDRTRREKVMGRLLALDEGLRPALPALLSLLDVTVDDAGWAALDPVERRQQIREWVRRLLLRESRVQPVGIVIEDLHWIDPETQSVLDNLVESIGAAPIVLLVNYRPEYRDGWIGKSFYRRLRIDPLPPARVEELLGPLLGDDPALEPLKRLLARRTEGNPLFLEESVRALVETGTLTGERGRYRLEREPDLIPVPATVQAILAARIDRLTAEDKVLLQAAAVVGHEVPVSLLDAIADLTGDALALGLRRLQAAEFLYEARLFPDLEYVFKHPLTHEVAYESLLHERRRALHARIIDALERLYPERLGEHADRLAHHAFRGELWAKAVTYLREAGAKALRASASVAARGCLEQALGAFERLPPDRRTAELAIDLRLELRRALLWLGEFELMHAHLREARGLAEAIGDEGRLAWVLVHTGEPLRASGEHRRGIDAAERALALAAARGDKLLEVNARFHLGAFHGALGDFERAIQVLEPNGRAPAIALFLSVAGALAPVPACLGLRAAALAQMGHFSEAEPLAEQALRIAEQSGRPPHLPTAWYWLGFVHLRRGDVEQARSALERAAEVARTYEIWFLLDRILACLACATAMADRAADALAQLRELATHRGRRSSLQPATTETWRAETYLHIGQAENAREAARGALTLAGSRGERANEADARLLVGHAVAEEVPGEADRHYRDALGIATDLGMRPLVAHCHLGLGKLYHRTDRREQAQAHLATATTMYREMGMTYWLEKTEAEMAELKR
jgi:class 3 adenylate cyclase/tetratricopeptide (TPR) repeat protein